MTASSSDQEFYNFKFKKSTNLSLSNQLASIILGNHSFQGFMNNWRQNSFIIVLAKSSVNRR